MNAAAHALMVAVWGMGKKQEWSPWALPHIVEKMTQTQEKLSPTPKKYLTILIAS